jgi:hypothetical protein
MRLVYFFACLIVAWGLAEKAAGIRTDQMFAPGFEWFNWILAAIWLAYGIAAFVWTPR